MKRYFVNNFLQLISKYYSHDKTKILEIKYGLETLYITITKTSVIIFIAILLGTAIELLYFLLFYSLLRISGFGLHAKKSWQCWIASIITLNGIPFLSKFLIIPNSIKIIISIVSLIIILVYAPADTEKRPLINKNKRQIYKVICFYTAVIYSSYIFVSNNTLIINSMIFALVLESLLIMPATYKIFKLAYRNYEKYKPINAV